MPPNVTTRATSAASFAEQRRSQLQLERHRKFQRMYRNMTPEQRKIQRHNAFLTRSWKVPHHQRKEKYECIVCQGTLSKSHMLFMACDHPIHVECFEQHAIAHMSLNGMMTTKDLQGNSELMEALSLKEVQEICEEEYVYRTAGAPCPVCRLPFPMRHMTHFGNNRNLNCGQLVPRA